MYCGIKKKSSDPTVYDLKYKNILLKPRVTAFCKLTYSNTGGIHFFN